MTVREILKMGDARLLRLAEPVTAFDTPELHALIEEKNRASNKARVVAGYCWGWPSKKDPNAFDIVMLEHGYRRQWNLTQDGSLWIMADESVAQVGCIHTCQGLELDYVGVIIGPDLAWRNGRLVFFDKDDTVRPPCLVQYHPDTGTLSRPTFAQPDDSVWDIARDQRRIALSGVKRRVAVKAETLTIQPAAHQGQQY